MSGARPTAGVVVGYGSIGRYHAGVLAERYGRLAVVDTDTAALLRARDWRHDSVVASSLDELGDDWDWPGTVAVIATWGPSHASVFDDLAARGVTRVLCEKPMAASVDDAAGMAARAASAGVALGVHLHKRYSGFVEGVHELEAKFGLGELQAVVGHGGARCLVTNGIHYLDFVCALYDELPTKVFSTAVDGSVNPRSPGLGYYGGTAVWSFPSGRELTLAFSNGSSLYEQLHLYYRHAVIELAADDEAVVRHRGFDQIERNPSVTRSGAGSELLYTGFVPGFRPFPDPTNRLLAELEEAGHQVLSPGEAVSVLGACVGALVSGRDGEVVSLPIEPGSALGRTPWPIS